jgi:hypothetical protein
LIAFQIKIVTVGEGGPVNNGNIWWAAYSRTKAMSSVIIHPIHGHGIGKRTNFFQPWQFQGRI